MKALVGFVAGAALAAGIVLFVVNRNQPAEPVATTVQAPAEVATPAPVAAEQTARPEAPSPPPVTRKKPARKVAKQRPPEPAAPPVQVATPKPEKEEPPVPPVETAKAAPPPEPAPKPVVDAPPPRIPHTATLPAGTLITVRLSETLSSDKNAPGDVFSAALDQPIVADGYVIAERGARVEGRVIEADKAGRVKGVSRLGIQLVKVNSSDGQKLAVQTDTFEKEGPTAKKEDAAKVGAAAGIGAAIGAIAGGGRGAAIGAAAGGAAGAGGVMATRGKPAELPVETQISFRLNEPVTITEKLR